MIKHRLNFYIFIFLIFCSLQIVSLNVNSIEPEEILENKELELRARSIFKNTRCLVCQNQSIDISTAPLAKDLRKVIRKNLVIGQSDKEIYNFLTERYGDFILLNPPFKKETYFLWFFPLVVFLLGIVIFYRKSSKKF